MRIRCGPQGINHFTWAGVVKLFPGFVHNCVGIALQPFYVRLQLTVLLLQFFNSLRKLLVFEPFLLVDRYAIVPGNRIVAEQDREYNGRPGRDPPPVPVE